MFCTQCGTEILPNQKYCTKCGLNLQKGVEQKKIASPRSTFINEVNDNPRIRSKGTKNSVIYVLILCFFKLIQLLSSGNNPGNLPYALGAVLVPLLMMMSLTAIPNKILRYLLITLSSIFWFFTIASM